jgi:FrmR/RcnR family transcriptional regulator, repressor of frmRAB operon
MESRPAGRCGVTWRALAHSAIAPMIRLLPTSRSALPWPRYRDERVGAMLDGMTHTIREKQKLLARIRRIRGQVEAIERAVDGEAGCEQVMHLIAGARGAIAGLMAEVVEDHVRTHLVGAEEHPNALKTVAAEQLLQVVRTYLK